MREASTVKFALAEALLKMESTEILIGQNSPRKANRGKRKQNKGTIFTRNWSVTGRSTRKKTRNYRGLS